LLVKSFGLKYYSLNAESDIEGTLQEVFADKLPCFVDVEINPDQKLYPVLKFGFPLEKQMPFLENDLVDSIMVIEKFEQTSQTYISKKQSKEGW